MDKTELNLKLVLARSDVVEVLARNISLILGQKKAFI